MNKEVQQCGYSSFSEKIEYDDWTGEIITKDQIVTYSNDNKYITNNKGEIIYIKQIKELVEENLNIKITHKLEK